jgi:hypothetical protein
MFSQGIYTTVHVISADRHRVGCLGPSLSFRSALGHHAGVPRDRADEPHRVRLSVPHVTPAHIVGAISLVATCIYARCNEAHGWRVTYVVTAMLRSTSTRSSVVNDLKVAA